MSAPQKKVLFVDDDPAFLEVFQQIMDHYAGGAWDIMTATDAGQGLALLQEHKFELLVIDLHMPVVDGLQFLSLLQRKYPNIMKVVMTGAASEESRAACLANGAELFLEKPRDPESWQGIYTALNELARLAPQEGFRGLLREVNLPDILQMSCLASHSLVLQIHAGGLDGQIFVRDGQIIHAQCGDRSGENAFNFLMGLAGGDFELKPFAEPPVQSIEGPWEFLLMEAARKHDENGDSAEKTGNTEHFIARLNAWQAAAPPPAFEAEEEPVVLPDMEAAPPAAEPAGTWRPQIEELLVCSVDGTVLHDWQCPAPDTRISLMEFLCQKARQMEQTLPLGEFDRLEINGPRARAVAQLHPERALFLRSARVPAETPLRP